MTIQQKPIRVSAPSSADVLAAKAKDLPSLLQAVADAAKVGSALWFSYIFLLFFLLVAVSSVTHRDLFLENPVALPFLSVNLPVVAFFLVGPALFLVAHTYVLLHFVLLADKVRAFHIQLQAQVKNARTRMQLRRQLPSDIFAQTLGGPSDIRNGTIGVMLKLIAWISLVIGPLLLLLLFELQFLAYHHWAATWWHRIAIAVDLLLLWRLWPSIMRGRIAGPSWLQIKRSWLAAFGSFAAMLFAITVATYPGEALNRLPRVPMIYWKCNPGAAEWLSVYDVLVGDGCRGRMPRSVWPNRLVLANFEPSRRLSEVGPGATPAVSRLDLTARNLERMVMVGGDLRKANLTDANLRGAIFDEIQMQGANLTTVDLAGAIMFQVSLQEATLSGAGLQGATLAGVNLAGAMLSGTRLLGASLDNVILRGATLFSVKAHGASLKYAHLEGALLAGLVLQGGDLSGATLDGASLQTSQLQGARLDGASLAGTDLRNTYLWRGIGVPEAGFGPNWTVGPGAIWRPEHLVQEQTLSGPKAWTTAAFQSLRAMIEKEVPEGQLKAGALERIKILECDQDPCDSTPPTAAMIVFRQRIEKATVGWEVYSAVLAEVLDRTICSAPELEALTGMARNGRLRAATAHGPALIDRILGASCPVGKLLSVPLKAELEAIRASAPVGTPAKTGGNLLSLVRDGLRAFLGVR